MAQGTREVVTINEPKILVLSVQIFSLTAPLFICIIFYFTNLELQEYWLTVLGHSLLIYMYLPQLQI